MRSPYLLLYKYIPACENNERRATSRDGPGRGTKGLCPSSRSLVPRASSSLARSSKGIIALHHLARTLESGAVAFDGPSMSLCRRASAHNIFMRFIHEEANRRIPNRVASVALLRGEIRGRRGGESRGLHARRPFGGLG